MKELEDPESTSDLRTESWGELEVKESISESGVKRVDALRVTLLSQAVFSGVPKSYSIAGVIAEV